MQQELYERFAKITKLEKQLNEIYHRLARKTGMSDSAFWTLHLLYETGAGMTQNDIAETMGFPKQTVHSAVRSLAGQGFVVLEQMPGARNNKSVRLTEAGQAFCDIHLRAVLDSELTAAKRMEGDLQTYIQLSERMDRYLQEELLALIAKTEEQV